MKLELKHLAPYLPYRLKVFTNITMGIRELSPKENNRDDVTCWAVVHLQYKPFLRPLSGLKREIENNDRKIIILPKTLKELKEKGEHAELALYEWEFLFAMHFDFYGLIDAGLAIEKNA